MCLIIEAVISTVYQLHEVGVHNGKVRVRPCVSGVYRGLIYVYLPLVSNLHH